MFKTEMFFRYLNNSYNMNDCSNKKGFKLTGEVCDWPEAPLAEFRTGVALLHVEQLVMANPFAILVKIKDIMEQLNETFIETQALTALLPNHGGP